MKEQATRLFQNHTIQSLFSHPFSKSCFGVFRAMATSSHLTKDDVLTSSEPASVPRSFKRIRMATKEDFLASYSILASFIRHPEAAYSVEELIVNPLEYHSYPYTRLDGPPVDTGVQEFNDELHDSIVDYIRSLGLGDETTDMMLQALDLKRKRLKGEEPEQPLAKRPRVSVFGRPAEIHNYDSAVAVLLIALCPNIVTLRIYNVWSHTPLGQFLLKNNYGLLQKPALQKLREVQLHPVNCQDERCYDYLRTTDYFRYFHRLPAINSLSLEGFEDYQAENTLFPPKTSSGIKKVHIGHSDMSGGMIRTIMLIPKTLEEFSLSTYGLMNCDGGTSMLLAKTLVKALLQYRSCLKVLDLDARVTNYHSSSDDDDDSEDADEEPDKEKDYAVGSREWCLIQDKQESDGATLLADDPAKAREYPAQSVGSLHDFTALTHLSIVSRPHSLHTLVMENRELTPGSC
jgi:hypothetical protein